MTIETVFFNFIENTMKGILLNLDKRNNLFSLLIRINDASKKRYTWLPSSSIYIPGKPFNKTTLDAYNQLIFFAEALEKSTPFYSNRGDLLYLWGILNKHAINYFASLFEKDYGSLFKERTLEYSMKVFFSQTSFNPYDEKKFIPYIYYLIYKEKFVEKRLFRSDKIITSFESCYDIFSTYENHYKITAYSKSLATPRTEYGVKVTIDDIDVMTGIEFEEFIGILFEKLGYVVTRTKTSGDQGVDLIVEKNKDRIGIQTKCYTSNVSNKAVQEIIAGLRYYDLGKGIVITNNYYTAPAKKLADVSNIALWDRDMLKLKLNSA
ncbi:MULTISPECIES: restriction endonuclease [Paenibacillus]|uniref:restriction endonuclease n=1 Tax=Paenibacillus TaxID=44249 RepID=UPI001C4D1449|nr:restriction endonuclease [Paenibacillus odorifer]